MTKQIEDYTVDELSAKINAIKAERERTANALKRYEEELESRKKEVPLGVPLADTLMELPYDAVSRAFLMWFSSCESADKFGNDYLDNFVKALRDIAEGKPIDIKVLLPLLRKGWVAMDKNGDWYWFENKPSADSQMMCWRENDDFEEIRAFNLKPATDWKESLMECGL